MEEKHHFLYTFYLPETTVHVILYNFHFWYSTAEDSNRMPAFLMFICIHHCTLLSFQIAQKSTSDM